jgi:hypothetical protein
VKLLVSGSNSALRAFELVDRDARSGCESKRISEGLLDGPIVHLVVNELLLAFRAHEIPRSHTVLNLLVPIMTELQRKFQASCGGLGDGDRGSKSVPGYCF